MCITVQTYLTSNALFQNGLLTLIYHRFDFPDQWTIPSNLPICLFSWIFHISIPINWIDYVNPINTIDLTCFFSCFIFICIVFNGWQMSSFLLKVSTSFPSGRVRVRPHFHLPEEDKILGKDLTCDNVRCKNEMW